MSLLLSFKNKEIKLILDVVGNTNYNLEFYFMCIGSADNIPVVGSYVSD